MGNENKPRILIIGSKGHKLSKKCIDWGDYSYISDYDMVIVNTVSLDEKTLKELIKSQPSYLEKLRDQIVEGQIKKGLNLICITEVLTMVESHSKDKKINNYSWCPVIPIFEESPGEKIDEKGSRLKLKYRKLIKGWERLYSNYYNNSSYTFEPDNERKIYFKVHLNKLVVNEIGRAIAFGLHWKIHQYDDSFTPVIDSQNPIIFLPKVKDIKESINLLLEDYATEEEVPPPWVDKFSLPNELDIKQKIDEHKKQIKRINSEKNKLILDLEKLCEFKKLLWSTGLGLEDIVEKSLLLLNINIKSPDVNNKEDRVFKEENVEIPIEIRGKAAGLNEQDLNQLTARFVDKPINKKYQTRGVFVLNHFRTVEPDKREDAFHYNIIEKAKSWQVALITTEIIYRLLEKKLEGKEVKDLKNKIFNTIGVFSTAETAMDETTIDKTI